MAAADGLAVAILPYSVAMFETQNGADRIVELGDTDIGQTYAADECWLVRISKGDGLSGTEHDMTIYSMGRPTPAAVGCVESRKNLVFFCFIFVTFVVWRWGVYLWDIVSIRYRVSMIHTMYILIFLYQYTTSGRKLKSLGPCM